VRQWILLRLLSARHHGASVKEMADEMGVSAKTIRRDLEAFQQQGSRWRKSWKIMAARNGTSTRTGTSLACRLPWMRPSLSIWPAI